MREWFAESSHRRMAFAPGAPPTVGRDLALATDARRVPVVDHLGPSRAICVRENDRALGRVAVRLPEFASDAVRCEAVCESDQPGGELSYWLVPEARGRGLAYAAVQMMISTVLVNAGLRSVVLDIEADNVPSTRLAERLGAERRSPARVKRDRSGTARTLVVYVVPLAG